MTDTDRKRVDPVEVVATELRKNLALRMVVTLAASKPYYEAMLFETSASLTEAALEALSKSGFLNENYYEWKRGQGK